MNKKNPFLELILSIAKCKIYVGEHFIGPMALLIARLYIGMYYWMAGQTTLASYNSTRTLFENEYLPNWKNNHIKNFFGTEISFPIPSVKLGMMATTGGALVFSMLLMIGFMGRFAAFGIFMMTLAIEMFVYPGIDEHYYWLMIMAIIMAYGPGKLSVDHFIRGKMLGDLRFA